MLIELKEVIVQAEYSTDCSVCDVRMVNEWCEGTTLQYLFGYYFPSENYFSIEYVDKEMSQT